MFVFYTKAIGDQTGLLAWARAQGHKAVEVETGSQADLLGASTRENLTGSDRAILIDYPIATQDDLSFVTAFATHATTTAGNWYYAPRPNEYVAVSKASLVSLDSFTAGIRPAVMAGGRAIQIAQRVADAIQTLPPPIRTVAFSTARKVWRTLRGYGGTPIMEAETVAGDAGGKPAGRAKSVSTVTETEPTTHPATDPAAIALARQGIPKVALPSLLEPFGLSGWQQYAAPSEVVRRDLLERVEQFFPHPIGIHVVVLNKCNLECVMCPFHSPVYKEGHKSGYFDDYKSMKPEVFERIAEYAGKHKISLQFGQIEEPLMHKRIVDFLNIAKAKGVPYMHMTTNGTLLTPDKADQLLESGLTSMMVSLDASDPETYKAIRGDDLEKIEANLRYFVPLARARGIKTWVSFILQEQAVGEREAFIAKWRDVGVDHITFYALGEHDKGSGELVNHTLIYDRDEERYPCAAPWVQSVVFPDGEVSLCCRTMGLVGWEGVVSVGTLAKNSYEEIWGGKRYRTVRDELLRGEFDKFPICQKCVIWSASTAIVEKTTTYERVYNETMETYTFTTPELPPSDGSDVRRDAA